MIGHTIDHCRIESKLGEGGMGVVFKARDTHFDRPVAIKVLPPDKVADAGRKQRFVQEARAASALNHPNIVTIYDIRSEQGMDVGLGQSISDLDGAVHRLGRAQALGSNQLIEGLTLDVLHHDEGATASSIGI